MVVGSNPTKCSIALKKICNLFFVFLELFCGLHLHFKVVVIKLVVGSQQAKGTWVKLTGFMHQKLVNLLAA